MGTNYPDSKDQHANSGPRPDAVGQIINEFLQEFIVVSAMGTWFFLKSFFTRKAIITIPLTVALAYGSYWIAARAMHLTFLYQLEPRIFTPKVVNWAWRQNFWYHYIFVLCTFFSPFLLLTGGWMRSVRTKFQRIFLRARLTNGLGDTPKLIYERRIDKYRKKYVFDANGIGISDFETKKEAIASHFKTNIESIKHGKHNGQIVVTFSKQKFPEKAHFNELLSMKVLPKESFYLGISTDGVHTQGIAELPHMLIAGTTGGGKSVFFKQCLLGLLESSPHMQMYLIDLKSGLEMIDFKKAPNVQVVKEIDHAVQVLRLVEKEMKDRFAYLEKANKKQIIPEIDHKDRIVIGVDEASVLYMNRSKHDPEYETALEARRLADSISKLSRAAAIHLLLATQKLDRQVIPTSVSENISGRMAFRANSLQGSLIVLGSKDACDLPEIPGRGIWSFGTRKIIVQAPFIDEKTITNRCEQMADLYQKGKRKMLSPMIGTTEKVKADNKVMGAYSGIQEQL